MYTGVNACVGRAGALRIFDIHFDLGQARSVGATEVITTCRATIATTATLVVISKVAVGATCQVGVEVMTTTPCGTIAVVSVQIVTVAVPAVFVVVGQREQEAAVVTEVTVVAIP